MMNIMHILEIMPNKRLKRDCQRVAFPVPLSRGGYGCCV
ncbi:death on curing protein, Doc toxin [Vibrio cholerae]|nr:death on curing protein, Doc toxin [Vibrio cholerae]